MTPQTYFDKVWDVHVVQHWDAIEDVLQVDRLLIHEAMGVGILRELSASQRSVHSPKQVFSFVDHAVDTEPAHGRPRIGWYEGATRLVEESAAAARRLDLHYIGADDPRQGIVHVAAPELGIALPALTIVCPDSHTCTLGGLGALAWGIGATQTLHVLATQTLVIEKPARMRVQLLGALQRGVSAKDVSLYLIAMLGANGALGHAVEFAGPVIDAMSVEDRMTLCNMAVEMAARMAFVAPDEKTVDYVRGRQWTPVGEHFEDALRNWKALATDDGAVFDREIVVDCCLIEPQVTWGTSPQQAIALGARIPQTVDFLDADERGAAERALRYQKLEEGAAITAAAIDVAYIGSCTNARITDLREAAQIVQGRHIAAGVTAICVPGSSAVKRQAEAEGLDRIFIDAGFEWHDAGCGMCASGRNRFRAQRVISTTNRNFENRQGAGTRTHLASPATVAASALAGRLCDPRIYLEILHGAA